MIFDIRRYSVHDGPGIRTTVFFKGCPLDCWWCHNPESQHTQPELIVRENLCIGCGKCAEACPQGSTWQEGTTLHYNRQQCTLCGKCVAACMASAREIVGRQMSVEQVMRQVERDIPFYDESGGGVTFSGGEPVLQWQFLVELLKACKSLELHTALDTCGFAAWDVLQRVAEYTDLFLYDLKHTDPELHLRYTGVPLAPILDNLERLAGLGKRIFLRLPLIPGINDDEANLRRLGQLAAGLPAIEQIDLLPYHHSAAAKYQRLDRVYRLPETQPPGESLEATVTLLQAYGINIKTGG